MAMKLVLLCSLSVLLAFVECDVIDDNRGIRGEPVYGETTVHKAWYSGFVGEFEIELENPATSWDAIITFPRRVFDLEVSNADIVDHFNHKRFRVRSRCDGNSFQPGDSVRAFFVADTFHKLKGLTADVKLVPFFEPRV
ncbi:uncharacterized protein [Amphiura filiformis]|uniref:uncharacterized protein n=1 Tax=Amphiura filiformis TaxID=82378 RepID=UPI003B219A46